MAVGVTSSSQIQNWVIGDREVILSRHPTEANYLKYTIREKGALSEKTFEVTRYEMSFALKLVNIFRDVIARRLELRSIDQSSFLPIMCVEALKHGEGGKCSPLQGLKVALFGTLDLVQERVENVVWAIFDETKEQVVSTLPQATNEILNHFFCNAPRYDRPNEDKNRNYKMSGYAKQFRVIVNYDRFDEPREVELQRCSLLDRDVLLDENRWAITLVSTRDAFGSIFEKIFRTEIGHAMIACEGIREGSFFLTYIHFTQRPRPTNPPSHLLGDEGQIEIFDKEFPLDTENGPVWSRSRVLVDNMLNFAKSRVGQPAKFALYGPTRILISSLRQTISNYKMKESSMSLVDSLVTNTVAENWNTVPHTCLGKAMTILELGGVLLYRTSPLRKPLQKVRMLNENSSFEVPNEMDCSCILERKPFPPEYQDRVKKMLYACVVLIPNNSTPREAALWSKQLFIEELEQTRLDLARKDRAKTLKEALRDDYKPPLW